MKNFKSMLLVFCFLLANFVYADWTSFQLTDDNYAESMPSIALDSYGNPNFAWCSNDDGDYDIYYLTENTKNAEIIIYNFKGQKIKTFPVILNPGSSLRKGQSSIQWDGKNEYGKTVNSGMYFYRLSINGKTKSTNKCLLVR